MAAPEIVTIHDRDYRRETGGLARALPHEVDHLDGILFVACLTDPTRLWNVSELSAAAKKEAVHI